MRMTKVNKNFQVGLKAILNNNGSFLALKDAYSEYWDIPGGRIEANEIDLPVSECLRREVLEELGLSVRFEIKEIVDVCKFKVSPSNKLAPNINLFLVFYHCLFLGGEILLNDESHNFRWLTKSNYQECNFGSHQKVIDQYVKKYLT